MKIDEEKWKKELEEMNKGKRGAQHKMQSPYLEKIFIEKNKERI